MKDERNTLVFIEREGKAAQEKTEESAQKWTTSQNTKDPVEKGLGSDEVVECG